MTRLQRTTHIYIYIYTMCVLVCLDYVTIGVCASMHKHRTKIGCWRIFERNSGALAKAPRSVAFATTARQVVEKSRTKRASELKETLTRWFISLDTGRRETCGQPQIRCVCFDRTYQFNIIFHFSNYFALLFFLTTKFIVLSFFSPCKSNKSSKMQIS